MNEVQPTTEKTKEQMVADLLVELMDDSYRSGVEDALDEVLRAVRNTLLEEGVMPNHA